MARITEPRIGEASATGGTGPWTTSAALTSHRRFAAVCSIADTFWGDIEAVDASGLPTGDWAEGLCTYSAANEITLTTLYRSSNSDLSVSFTGAVYIRLIADARQIAKLENISGAAVADTQVIFADGANNPAGSAGFTFNKTAGLFTVPTKIVISTGAVGNGTPIFASSGWSFYNSNNAGNALVLNGVLKVEGGPVKLRASDGLQWVTSNSADNLTADTAACRVSAGLMAVTDGPSIADGGVYRDFKARYSANDPKTVATLSTAASAGAGARSFVTDATATTFASIVAGGGANGVPVYSDGTNWRIG